MNKTKTLKIAIVGATGAVGREMLKILETRDFPANEIILLASKRSVGIKIPFKNIEIKVQELTNNSFIDIDLALFSAGGSISEQFAPIAVKAGCVVIDNSNAWRMDKNVPLVIPEVNPNDLDWHKGIIANPNCSTIQMLVALKPIHDVATIKRIVVSTYQAVSGTGQKAITEMEQQVRNLFSGSPCESQIYPYQIAFNCLPQIDIFLDDDYTKEELKMVRETHKILDKSIKVTATAVRVPVFYSHSESINIETEKNISPKEARIILSQAPGIKVMDNPQEKLYPMPLIAGGYDEVFVGRIRKDNSIENGLNLFVVADNLRKGAALNAVQIAEKLIEKNLLKIQ